MKKVLKIFLCILFILSFSSIALAAGKILLVHSYHQGYSWTDAITMGVKKGLEGSGVQLEIFYMDTKRKTSEEWKVKAGEKAKEKVASYKPDVVIASDDNAQIYFVNHYVGKLSPQFVFCGVNADVSKYGYPTDNITGILERPLFSKSIELLQQIKGDIKTIAIITDDGITSSETLAYFKTLVLPLKIVSIDQPSLFSEWQALIKKYQTTVDAIMIFAYDTVKKSPESDSMNPKEVIDWTMSNNTKPTVGFIDFAMNDGVLCGVAESGEEHGLLSAETAIKILKGKKASDFPIKTAQMGTVIINIKTAKKLGIDIPPQIIQSAQRIIEK